MIRSTKFTCILDTNVIHPLHIRDYLLYLADADLYTPKWSKHIFDEWGSLMECKGNDKLQIQKRINAVRNAFPFAEVVNYEHLIDQFNEIPDPKDRHVVAAAVRINANLIVTWNLKDFPSEYLSKFGLSVANPDDFIADIIDLHNERAVEAFREMVLAKKNPPYTEIEMLQILKQNGLEQSSDYLRAII
ncbi:PIN domain-containing protein [Marinoscillum pacificum]|uniref:PIN domain-containing protein n=1 Tax=Marinoscillum pacificum TaxID=392723 RepID=UPI0021577DE2|nr:PIN domain-containing protein [Marinoscillum pacificum]